MSNQLSAELIAQLFAQESNDPFLALITLTHASFASPIRLVNNSENIISRGNTFTAFPMKIKLPMDDGESAREVQLVFDNVSLELIDEIRTVTTSIGVSIELVLASMPNQVQASLEELKIATINYNKTQAVARLVLDSFLTTEVTSERYNPQNFPGLF